MKLNIGAGETKLEGYINIDSEAKTQPDLVHDIRKAPLPYEDNSIDEIVWFHCIEHLEFKYWPQVIFDFWRLLKPETGQLLLAYPEFSICAENFVKNARGMREFWRATLYGRQLYTGDYHIAPVHTEELLAILQEFGFTNIKYGPEVNEPYNTFLACSKGERPLSREEVLEQEIFK